MDWWRSNLRRPRGIIPLAAGKATTRTSITDAFHRDVFPLKNPPSRPFPSSVIRATLDPLPLAVIVTALHIISSRQEFLSIFTTYLAMPHTTPHTTRTKVHVQVRLLRTALHLPSAMSSRKSQWRSMLLSNHQLSCFPVSCKTRPFSRQHHVHALRSRAPLFARLPFPKPRRRRALMPTTVCQVSKCLWWILEDMVSLGDDMDRRIRLSLPSCWDDLDGMDSIGKKAAAGGALGRLWILNG